MYIIQASKLCLEQERFRIQHPKLLFPRLDLSPFFISLLLPAVESIPALIVLSETHHGMMMGLLAEHSVECNAEWDLSRSAPDDSWMLYSIVLVVGLWRARLLFVCFSVTNHLWHNQTMTSQWLEAVCVCGSVAFVYSVIKWFENSLPTLSLSKWSGVISSRFQMHAEAQVKRQINTKLAKYKSKVFDTLQKS